MEKIIFFTAGSVPTAAEATDIAQLQAMVAPKYELSIMKGGMPDADYQYGFGKQPADFVAGVVPSPLYDGVPVINPDELPATVLDGAVVPVRNSVNGDNHNATAYTNATGLDHVQLASTVAMVDNADTFPGVTGAGTTATFTVAGGVITAIVLS